jgi:hypothetical protein
VSLVDLRNTSEEGLEAGFGDNISQTNSPQTDPFPWSSNRSLFRPHSIEQFKGRGSGSDVPEFEAGFKDAVPIDAIEIAICVEVDEQPLRQFLFDPMAF